MKYYILEFERPTTATFWKTNYETLRYVYTNKKTALKMLKKTKEYEDLRNPRIITATTNEVLSM